MKTHDGTLKRFIPARWKTLLALTMAGIAINFNLLFIWGAFCLFWGVENIRSREAYFVERIERNQNPLLYWVIIAAWFTMGVLYFYFDYSIRSFIRSF